MKSYAQNFIILLMLLKNTAMGQLPICLINDQDQIHCSFVMGKSRVRPLKCAVTVPKLELTAATLAVKINKVVIKSSKDE